jgi:superfamily II DNA or RNA helicase
MSDINLVPSLNNKVLSIFETLREYQKEGIQAIDEYIQTGTKRILRQNYTGTGKSVEQLYLTVRHILESKNNCVLFLMPTDELIQNQAEYLLKNGIQVSYIKSGRAFLNNSQVYIASVATLVKRLDILPIKPTMIIADECHHSPSNTWSKCFNHYQDIFKIGFSATPERLDGKPFKTLFDVMVQGKPYSYYVENGFLSPYQIAPIKALSQQFKKKGGEFDLSEQQEFYNNPVIIGNCVDEWVKFCLGEKTIVFCSGIEHSKNVVESYNEFGLKHYGKQIAEHLDGTTDKKHRKATFERFKLPLEHSESLLILSNVALFIEGINIPSASVTQWLRMTASSVIYDQGNGRSNRYVPGKIQTILDHVGNLGIHGSPDRSRYFDLQGRKKKEKLEKYTLTCQSCNHVLCTDFRKLSPSILRNEWIPCPECEAPVLLPKASEKAERSPRKEIETDETQGLELLELDNASKRVINLHALFKKYERMKNKQFFDKLLLYPDISLEDLKLACRYRNLPENNAFGIYSRKIANVSKQLLKV